LLLTPIVHADTLAEYKPVQGISGRLVSVGSDTMANLMTKWLDEFRKLYPNVAIEVQAAGSSTAAPALTENTSSLAPMSRPMRDQEIEGFEKKFGYKPTQIRVAIDAVVLYVHKDNPLSGLTLEQVDAIFSATRQCGAAAEITQWQQLGLGGTWKDLPIQIFGRNSVSGSYGYFKEHALCKGDFRTNVNEQPGSSAVVQSVNNAIQSIGYAGVGYKTSGVKFVPLAHKPKEEFVEPTDANILSNKYPLSRFLYIYVNKPPHQALSPLELEFMKLVLSKQGQMQVNLNGYTSMTPQMLQKELAKLQ
jgi:phosphate transport system substrate-binding protein